jgi:hypothetical protein
MLILERRSKVITRTTMAIVAATAPSICRARNDVSFYLFYDKEDEIECREKIVYVKNETKQLTD